MARPKGGTAVNAWPKPEAARAKAMWKDGASATEISRTLWVELRSDRSKNAVIGLINRSGLQRSTLASRIASKINAPRNPPRPPAPRLTTVKTVPAATVNKSPKQGAFASTPPELRKDPLGIRIYRETSTAVDLVGLERGMCHFTVGEATGASQLFCGAPTSDKGKRFCPGCSRTGNAVERPRRALERDLRKVLAA